MSKRLKLLPSRNFYSMKSGAGGWSCGRLKAPGMGRVINEGFASPRWPPTPQQVIK